MEKFVAGWVDGWVGGLGGWCVCVCVYVCVCVWVGGGEREYVSAWDTFCSICYNRRTHADATSSWGKLGARRGQGSKVYVLLVHSRRAG